VKRKVNELVIMGGGYPSGREYNFRGDNASLAAHVVHSWPGRVVYSGSELGKQVKSGVPLMKEGPTDDPVRAAYIYYTYYNSRQSWDPLTVLYAMDGLGDMFEFANKCGYNQVFPNGSNSWVYDETRTDQHWLKLKVDKAVAEAELDRLFLRGAWSVVNESSIPVLSVQI
jgi:hypothetical protein